MKPGILFFLLLFSSTFPFVPIPAQESPRKNTEEVRKELGAKVRELSKMDPRELGTFLARLEEVLKKTRIRVEGREVSLDSVKGVGQFWDVLVEALMEENLPWKEGHFLNASLFFIRRNDPLRGEKICLAGKKKFPKSRFIMDNLGLAYLQEAKLADTRGESDAAAKKAYRTFKRALALEPDTFHAHFGLFQAARILGRYETALKEMKKFRAFPGAPKLPEKPRTVEGQLLLGVQDFPSAASILDDPKTFAEDPGNRILAMRARILEGKKERALALAEEMERGGVDPRLARWAEADLLIYLGKGREAVHFLKKHPVRRKKKESEGDFKLAKEAQAGLRFLSLLTPKTAGKIRRGLPKILDHKFILLLQGKRGGKPRKVLLNKSSIAMGKLMLQCPTSVKKGENALYLALLSLDLQKHRPTPFEKKNLPKDLIENKEVQRLGSPQGLRDCVRKLERGLMDPEFNCALTAWTFARYLRTRLD